MSDGKVDRQEAFDLLSSDSAVDRLRAARALFHLTVPSDRDRIRQALTAESDAWVRSALLKIADSDFRTSEDVAPTDYDDSGDDLAESTRQLANDIRAQTTQTLTDMVIHELQPLLGTLRTAHIMETSQAKENTIQQAISGIQSFLEALRGLSRASDVPSVSDFNLSDTVFEAIKTVTNERMNRGSHDISVDPARSDHVAASGDRHLVRLTFLNVLRNALEASDPSCGGSARPVVVNWGTTDCDAWISVFDRGIGLPAGASQMTEPGVTTKSKDIHSGMGLTICKTALANMNGTLNHRPRGGGGVVTEMRWKGDEHPDARAAD